MRTKSGGQRSATSFFVMLLTLVLVPTWAQEYSIDWHTLDGGGGSSTGGVYVLTGTIGQLDAGAEMTGGTYSLQGGFWALPVAVQIADGPILRISPASPGFAEISWDPPTPGYVLESSPSLSAPEWTDVPEGDTSPVVVPANWPAIYYRLHKPRTRTEDS